MMFRKAIVGILFLMLSLALPAGVNRHASTFHSSQSTAAVLTCAPAAHAGMRAPHSGWPCEPLGYFAKRKGTSAMRTPDAVHQWPTSIRIAPRPVARVERPAAPTDVVVSSLYHSVRQLRAPPSC